MDFRHKQQGFSLLEILISIVLLSFIMIGVVTVTDNSMRTSEEVTAEDNKYLQIETALSILEWDLTHLYSPRFFANDYVYTQRNPSDGQVFSRIMQPYERSVNFSNPTLTLNPVPTFDNPGPGSLKIFTNSHRRRRSDDASSHYAWVLYNVQDGKLLRAEFSQNPYTPEQLSTALVKTQVLLENVDKLSFQFWDRNLERYVDGIRQVADGSKILWGIKVLMTLREDEERTREIERVYRPLWQERDLFYTQQTQQMQQTPRTQQGQQATQ